MKLREHRGDRASSLATSVDVADANELFAHVAKVLSNIGITVSRDQIEVSPYRPSHGPDHIVTVKGHGVFGFTDFPWPEFSRAARAGHPNAASQPEGETTADEDDAINSGPTR